MSTEQKPIDDQIREAMRFAAACAAMQGMLAYSSVDEARGNWQLNAKPADVAVAAVEYADALLAALAPTEATQ